MTSTEKNNIIIADDHQMIIDGIKSMLASGTGYEVVEEAANGQEAIDKIDANPGRYHVLITDISMALLSGIDLCRIVKDKYPHLKVLILSMYNSAPMVKEAVSAEADGFILKNSGRDELLQALHRITNGGTWYAEELLPVIYNQIQQENKQRQLTAILTDREREVLQLIVAEYTSEEIARKLSISKKTVDNHRAHLLEKTGCKSTIGLVKYALENEIT